MPVILRTLLLDLVLSEMADFKSPAIGAISYVFPGVLTGVLPDTVSGANEYRVYGSVLTSSARLHKQSTVSQTPIVYRVGSRARSAKASLVVPMGERVDQRFKYNDALSAELSGLNRKYTNFTGAFEVGDLSAVIYRLSAGMTAYACHGTLTWQDLMAGAQLNVRSLGVMDTPVAASDAAVFVPRTVDMAFSGAAFSALVAAVNSSGGLVVTDIVSVDANNNAPQIVTYDGIDLAMGCYTALRMLLHMYDVCGMGAIAAVAFACGVHSVATVVGHTDEGAIMRACLRGGRFAVPFGGVYVQGFRDYCGLPTPSNSNPGSFTALVDTIALVTAAGTALSDPLVEVETRKYPTVIASRRSNVSLGRSVEGTVEDALDVGVQLIDGFGDFATNYATLLTKFFGMSAGGVEVATRKLTAGVRAAVQIVDRHLHLSAVAPYYWIEPTSLFTKQMGTEADECGYGILAGTVSGGSMPYFEEQLVKDSGPVNSHVAVAWRSARTSGFVIHHANHVNDGLGAAYLQQAVGENFAFRGGADEGIFESMLARRPLADYLWGRGDAGLPAPAELLHVGRSLLLKLNHGALNADLDYERTAIATCDELLSGVVVSLNVTKPCYAGVMGVADRTRTVRRARTQAAKALSQTLRLLGGKTGGEVFAISNTEPVVFEVGPVVTDAGAGVQVVQTPPEQPGLVRRGVPAAVFATMGPERVTRQRQAAAPVALPAAMPGPGQHAENVENIIEEANAGEAGAVGPAPAAQ